MKKPQNRDPAERQPNGQFGAGNRANPGGQPKWVATVRAMLDEGAPEAVDYLRSVVVGGPVKSTLLDEEGEAIEGNTYPDIDQRTAAAKVVLDYAVPKPKLTIEHEHKAPTKTLAELGMSDEEICALARQALEKTK